MIRSMQRRQCGPGGNTGQKGIPDLTSACCSGQVSGDGPGRMCEVWWDETGGASGAQAGQSPRLRGFPRSEKESRSLRHRAGRFGGASERQPASLSEMLAPPTFPLHLWLQPGFRSSAGVSLPAFLWLPPLQLVLTCDLPLYLSHVPLSADPCSPLGCLGTFSQLYFASVSSSFPAFFQDQLSSL